MTSKSKTAKTKAQPASKKPAAKVPAKVAKAVEAKNRDTAIKEATKVITDQAKKTSKVLAKAAKTHEGNGNKLKAAALKKAADGFAKAVTVNKVAPKALPAMTVAKAEKAAVVLKTVAKEQTAQGNDVTAKILETTAKKFDKVAAKAVLIKPDAKKPATEAAPKVTVKKAETVSLPPSKTTIVPNKSQYKAVTTKKAPAAPKGTVSTAKTISIAELSQAMRSSQTPSNQKPALALPVKPVVQTAAQPNVRPVEDRDAKVPHLRTQSAGDGKMSVQELFGKMATNATAATQAAQLPAFLRR